VLQPTQTPSSAPPETGPRITAFPHRLRRGAVVWAAAGTALLLGLLWSATLARVTGDLAAQWAWADFAAQHPGSAYDLGWYGGMYPASYSVLAPYLMAWFGVRTVAVAAAVVSAALLAVLLLRSRVRRPLPVALWGAFALSCDVVAGRVTFALGLMFGLASVAVSGTDRVVGGRRTAGAAALALLATLASPVAGLFVEVAAAALLCTGRRRTGLALAVPPPLVILLTTLLFPFAGVDPITVPTVLFSGGCALAVALLVPRRWRALRAGSAVYALGIGLTWSFSTPIGSNVQRLALIFGGVAALAALLAGPADSRARRLTLLAAFLATAYWTVSANLVGIPAPSSPGQADGLVAELRQMPAARGRLEAVPMVNHWESWGLVGSAELARGWNRQLDVRRNPLFYRGTLTAAAYHAWLQQWAVQYVALPRGTLDVAGRGEAALIRSGPAWLREVWHDRNWTLYRFADALPLAATPAVVDRADAARVVLTVPAPGPVTVRVAWSSWLSVQGAAGACLSRDGQWTRLDARVAGTYTITARYAWPHHPRC
jgi:hypothetical protein